MLRSNTIVTTIIVLCLILLYLLFLDFVPSEAHTTSSIISNALDINSYYAINQTLPEDLSVIPQREGCDDNMNDYWGRKIIYEYNSDNIVRLISYGKDGVPGGDGNNEDIIYEFKIPLDLENSPSIILRSRVKLKE